MLIELIILLVICVLLFNSVVYSIQARCPGDNIRIKYVRAGRLPGNQFKERVGITTINLKLDQDIPCGIYKLDTSYGKAVMFVAKNSNRIGYLNYQQEMLEANPETKKEIESADLFDIWNLIRINGGDNEFINTYNRGCC
jgi:hypothetical protein